MMSCCNVEREWTSFPVNPEADIHYMQRAMELAALGLGHVSPNPMVGCVVVVDNRIISEGWHKEFGGPHAEVHALERITDESLLARATVYVNLEPCSHFGKTPPCADLIIRKKVKRVVVANRDTSPKVSGNGMERIRTAGISVTEGILEKEGRWLNRRFFVNVEQGIPYVILKWAETADGYIGGPGSKQVWISNSLSLQRVHQWRSEEDAILVGTNTAAFDNPRLSVRDWQGRNPTRIVIDRSLRLPSTLNLFDQSQRTLCYNEKITETVGTIERVKVETNFLPGLLEDILKRGIGSVIVEGGAKTLQAFIDGNYWHEARVFKSGATLGQGIPTPMLRGKLEVQDSSSGDRLSVFTNPAR